MNEAMTTFFPSVLLIAISYITTFFKPVFFEAALSVNLTVLLVLTTLFISVMEKLPPTSMIKWMEWWLIFAQMIPFLEVIFLTLSEASMELSEDKTNHNNYEPNLQTIEAWTEMVIYILCTWCTFDIFSIFRKIKRIKKMIILLKNTIMLKTFLFKSVL